MLVDLVRQRVDQPALDYRAMVLDEARIGRAARGAQFRRRPADALDRGYQHLAERTGRRQEGFAADRGGEFVTGAAGVEEEPQFRIERSAGPGVDGADVDRKSVG